MVRLAVAVVAGLSVAQPSFHSNLDVVNVTVTVTGSDGRFVSELHRSDFSVFEDGRQREVVFFAGESEPVSLGVLLDSSGSMTGAKLGLARDSIARLIATDLDSTTEWFFARFTSAVVMAQEWTSDRAAIVQPLRETRATGDTSLYDAVALTIPIVKERHGLKKSLLVVTDGLETRSLVSLDEVQRAIGENDVRVYGVGIDAPRIKSLRRLSDETGGQTLTISNTAEIPAVTARLADALRHQYLLGYATPAAKDGRRHAIKVEVHRPRHTVSARRGFVAD